MYNLMIVEDDPLVRESLVHTIDWEKIGFRVTCSVSSGQEALSMIAVNSIDVVLVDIVMPGMNGLEFISKVKSMRRGILFVILSGYSEFKYAQQAISLSVYAY